CSNTGVIQTRPEVKWIITPETITQMHKIQLALLEQASKLTKFNGHIIYSTCSVSLEENEHVIRDFLANHPEFNTIQTEPWIGTPAFEGFSKCQRLFPHRNDTEGFFIAKLIRKPKPAEKEG
ncbi:MAG: hypothetical protein ACFFCO_10100, partial [Promethearchaeota archaeon]